MSEETKIVEMNMDAVKRAISVVTEALNDNDISVSVGYCALQLLTRHMKEEHGCSMRVEVRSKNEH